MAWPGVLGGWCRKGRDHSTAISYELAQDKIADLRRQGRRASAARNAQASAAQAEPRVHGRFRFHRRRVTAALG